MANVTPITEQFQHFVREVQESFWGDPRGFSARHLDAASGRVVGIVTEEVVSAQTVSRLTRSLDGLVNKSREAPLKDERATAI